MSSPGIILLIFLQPCFFFCIVDRQGMLWIHGSIGHSPHSFQRTFQFVSFLKFNERSFMGLLPVAPYASDKDGTQRELWQKKLIIMRVLFLYWVRSSVSLILTKRFPKFPGDSLFIKTTTNHSLILFLQNPAVSYTSPEFSSNLIFLTSFRSNTV